MFSERKRKVVKSFPMLLALFSAQVLLTVGGNGDKESGVLEDDEEMKCVCDGGCEHLRESDCPWGLTLDVCGCCFLCARGENEPCAGALGNCAIGLRCQLNPLLNDTIPREGTCIRSSGDCGSLVQRYGCNVRGGQCICEVRFGCPDEEMFLFDTEDACRSQTSYLIARKDLEPLSPSVSATDECRNVECPKVKECPPGSYRYPIRLDPSHEPCCHTHHDCLCNPGLVCPPPAPCPVGWISRIVTDPPGKCCTLHECTQINAAPGLGSEGCTFFGTGYESGATWTHQKDCTDCNCHHGVVSCKPTLCEIQAECSLVRTIPGSCCPICIGCITKSGKVYNNSISWMEDPCTTCECSEGRIKCQATMCQTTCLNPKYIPGECCPRCDAGDECPFMDCGLEECPHGFTLSNQTGCPTCTCSPCPNLAGCRKECEFGYQTNAFGCVICRCKRRTNHVRHEIRQRLLIPENEGIKCIGPNGIHINGQEWTEDCRKCICKNGSELCSLITCSPPKCEHPIFFPGNCCPKCPDEPEVGPLHYENHSGRVSAVCESPDGIQLTDGGIWKLGQCLTCTCHNGQELCSGPECPPSPCGTRDLIQDDCCWKCPNNTKPQRRMSEGNSFPAPTTTMGNHSAFESLSAANCFSDDSQIVYKNGETWKVGPCQSCICDVGQIQCFSEGKCPVPECERPLLAKNQCCPICLDKKSKESVVVINAVPIGEDSIHSNPTSSAPSTTEPGVGSESNYYKETSIPGAPTSDEELLNIELNGESLAPTTPTSSDPNCVVIISILFTISLALLLYSIKTYFYARRIRQGKNEGFHCSHSTNFQTTPSATSECCYANCTALSDQKTPLCHSHSNERSTHSILNTDKV